MIPHGLTLTGPSPTSNVNFVTSCLLRISEPVQKCGLEGDVCLCPRGRLKRHRTGASGSTACPWSRNSGRLRCPHRAKLPLPTAETLSLPASSSCSDSVSPHPHSCSHSCQINSCAPVPGSELLEEPKQRRCLERTKIQEVRSQRQPSTEKLCLSGFATMITLEEACVLNL